MSFKNFIHHIKSARFGSFKRRKNQKGIALILAVTTMALLVWLAQEVSQESLVEYTVNANALNRMKAYYAAKAGVDLSLLRIKTYYQAQKSFGKQLGGNSEMLDQIWKFPFAWPLPLPKELNSVDKDSIQNVAKESMMDASYMVTIEEEGSKIDLNDLSSASESLRKSTRTLLLNIFAQKVKDDREFADKYNGFRFDELVNQIADFMSDKNSSLNGGDKKSAYADLKTEDYPPNRGFRTLDELRLIPMMTEDFFDLLAPRVTIYGMKGINPNLANKEVLRSLDEGITEEVATEIIKRRDDKNLGGPFKDGEDFWSFINSKGAYLKGDPKLIPLSFESISAFKIRSTGEFSKATREIIAYVYDTDLTASRIQALVKKQQEEQQKAQPQDPNKKPTQPNAANPAGNTAQTQSLRKGPPQIVYWTER